MTRPSDWDAVFGISDPTPGDPWSIRSMQRSWSELADDAERAESKLRQLLGDEAISGWIGEGGNAFRDKTYDLPDQLGKCHRSYRLAADALLTWASRLETHQGDADRALVQGRAAKADLDAASSSVTSASGSDVLAFLERYADTPPPASVTPPSEEAIRTARARLSSAQSAQHGAQSRLDAARQLALDAGSLREEDGRTAARAVREASDAGIPERSRWEKFKDWAADAWDIIVEICKIVVLVLGVVALIIGGPLAWVVFAAALLVLADTIMKYLKGEASLWDVALAALACIPCTKGLTTLSELSAAFRSGGMLGAGAHILGAGKTALVEMAAALRGVGGRLALRLMSGETLAGARISDLATTVPGGVLDALHAGSADPAILKSVFKHAYGDVLDVNAARFALDVPGFNMNCTRCVVATDATLTGSAASALPVFSKGASPLDVASHFGSTWQHVAGYDAIVQGMLNAGEGARGIVLIDRGAGRVGHVFNVVHDANGVVFIDGQVGGFAALEKFKKLFFLPTS